MELAVTLFIAVFSTILIIQGIFNIYLLLYNWISVRKVVKFRSPRIYEKPRLSFTAILPARHEEEVIGDTIRAVSRIDYPIELTQILVVLRQDDTETIKRAQDALDTIGIKNIKIVVFDGFPINKPHGLNKAMSEVTNDVVVIFDAEDEPHRDIYHIVNTTMIRDNAEVVQCGVQLMNYQSNWYSLFNVLEYYFWFKSCLQFFAEQGVIPLGGNTVFFRKETIERYGGWDQECLTEDADIGLKLSQHGAIIRVVYDELHATQEETPPDLKGFIKQRTRWNQGFIQIITKGQWHQFNKFSHRVLAFYVLGWPIVQALLFLIVPVCIAIAIFVELPVLIALYSTLPLYIFLTQLLIVMLGLYEFGKDYNKKIAPKYYIKMIIWFFPYQWVLGFASLRAVWRFFSKNMTWEKTAHINAHRTSPHPA